MSTVLKWKLKRVSRRTVCFRPCLLRASTLSVCATKPIAWKSYSWPWWRITSTVANRRASNELSRAVGRPVHLGEQRDSTFYPYLGANTSAAGHHHGIVLCNLRQTDRFPHRGHGRLYLYSVCGARADYDGGAHELLFQRDLIVFQR